VNDCTYGKLASAANGLTNVNGLPILPGSSKVLTNQGTTGDGDETPARKTIGNAYCADSLDFMRGMPDAQVELAVTSPPYALHFKKEYGNADQKQYVAWFLPFAREIRRVLKPEGSFVIEHNRRRGGATRETMDGNRKRRHLCERLGVAFRRSEERKACG
jgi:hypothetical protein